MASQSTFSSKMAWCSTPEQARSQPYQLLFEICLGIGFEWFLVPGSKCLSQWMAWLNSVVLMIILYSKVLISPNSGFRKYKLSNKAHGFHFRSHTKNQRSENPNQKFQSRQKVYFWVEWPKFPACPISEKMSLVAEVCKMKCLVL